MTVYADAIAPRARDPQRLSGLGLLMALSLTTALGAIWWSGQARNSLDGEGVIAGARPAPDTARGGCGGKAGAR